MSVRTEIRKAVSEATPVMAAVGVTDLAVERVRKVAAEAGQLPSEFEARVTKLQLEVEKAVEAIDPAYLQKFFAKAFDPKTLQAGVKEVPALALTRVLEVAGKVEHRYEDLAARGKQLVTRIEEAPATKEAVRQTKTTVSRGKAAVTTARKAVDETVAEATEDAAEVKTEVKAAAKKTATTARKRATTTRSAVKRASTTAKGAATATAEAVESAAEKVGD